MPRRELLTPDERETLLAIPQEESERIRHYTLSRADLGFIRQHRWAHNRLGVAVQLCVLRYPGRVLNRGEQPPAALLGMIGAQLKTAPALWERYAARDQTRRQHQLELVRRLGLTLLSREHIRELVTWLIPIAGQTTQGMILVRTVIDELRVRKIVLPRISVIERIASQAATRADRLLFEQLSGPLTPEHRHALNQLLELRAGAAYSTLAWLRMPPGAPSARSVLRHMERLKAIRVLGLPPNLDRHVYRNRLLRLAREGAQTAVYQLKEYADSRRYATLVAIVLEAEATLTDEILDLHDRLIGSFFAKAKHKHEREFTEAAPALHETIQMYAKVGTAIVEAKEQQQDPFAAIEAVMPWEAFAKSVATASELAATREADSLGLLADYYGQLRRYAPSLLEMFSFQAAPAVKPLIDAIEVLRHVNQSGARLLPDDAPTAFVRRRWAPYVFVGAGVDRKFYELCALSELKNALRAGDVSVPGSRQFRDFDEYLIDRDAFAVQTKEARTGLSLDVDAHEFLSSRMNHLQRELDCTARLAQAGELPDVELTERGLKIKPLEDAVPPAAEGLIREVAALLPHVKITDLLLEVDRWTDFSRHFTHLKSGEAAKDRSLLLTAILADGINLGLTKMAEACPGTSFAKLSWLSSWHVRDETYSQALADLVNYQHRLPLAAAWGEGTTSSSDGQRFRAGGRGEAAGHVNARYGNEPGVLFYTHVSDQYSGYHVTAINTPARDATYVIDGLLYHESELRIEEHYTDTAGFTDHVFALCDLLGFRFAPRIRDLADKRLYVPGKASQWPALEPLIGATINRKLIEQHFDDILRLASSIKQGTVTASLILRKLAAYPRQNSLALALRELGRIERTLFTLEWLRDPALRRRVNAGLNKGEARNSLSRAVFLNRLGEIRDRSFENQRYRASGLNLIVTAITLWNTVYMERALAALRADRSIEDTLITHLSPLSWEHIHLTGDYVWHANKRVAKGRFRPLRRGSAPSFEA
jgi:TnpA family transposase